MYRSSDRPQSAAPQSGQWSSAAYRTLVEAGRAFAEQVLVHLETLEKMTPHSDPRDLSDADIRLEAALLDFQDAQIAYNGRGFAFLSEDSQSDDPPEGARGESPPTSPSASQDPSVMAQGHIVSVMTRHDFELQDQAAVESTAQEIATMAGATPVPKGDIGYAMAILNYVGLSQLTTTPGLQPLLEVNAITARHESPTREQIDASHGVEGFFETGTVLNSQTNMWDPNSEGPQQ